jgi:hypothetical protein
VGSFEEIKVLVSEGFLVRTRADAETREARSNDVKRRDLALSSGAQFVSTDFPKADPGLSEYAVRLPGKVVARINPVSGGKHDQKGELE